MNRSRRRFEPVTEPWPSQYATQAALSVVPKSTQLFSVRHFGGSIRDRRRKSMTHPFIKGTLFALLLAVAVKPSAPPWQPPKSDWLYVLDLDQSTAPEKSHILVVDPQKESVVEELPGSGYQTVFARSSDGKHVYVLGGTVLSVVDSSNGQITSQATVPQRIMFTGQPDIPAMAISSDDKTLVVEDHGTFFNERADQAFLESIDVSGATASSDGSYRRSNKLRRRESYG